MGLFDGIKTTGLVLSIFSDALKSTMKESKLMDKIDELNAKGGFTDEEKALIKEYKQIEKKKERLYETSSHEEASEKQKALDDQQEEVFAKLFKLLNEDAKVPDELKTMLKEYSDMHAKMEDKVADKVVDLVAKDAGAKTKEEKAALKQQVKEDLKNNM